MMQFSNIQLLLVVNFLHAACSGLIVPVLSPHVMMTGGNHVIMGMLVTGSYICQMLSKDFIALFEHGKKFILTFCMFTYFLTYLILAITTSCWMVVICRLIAALINQIDVYSKDFATLIEPELNPIKIFNLIDIMKTAGIVVGAIIGAYVFNCSNDFESNAMISAVCALTSVLILQNVDADPPGPKMKSNIQSVPQACCTQLKNLTQVNYKTHWDVFLLKTAYVTSFAIYFTKNSLLIRYNYGAGTIIVGYTVAYQNMLIFTSNCIVPFLMNSLARFPKKEAFEHSLLLCATILMAMYYAPTYNCYLFIFMPLILTYTLVNCFFEDDALDLKSKQEVYQAVKTLTTLINMFVPFVFGVVCHIFGPRAFKIIAILPPAACAYVINQRFLKKNEESEETDDHSHQD